MTTQALNITLIQADLHWLSPEANLAMLEEMIWQIPSPTDLIVLPEMFNTGFAKEAASLAEPMNLTTFKWMKQQAAQTGAVVTGSYVVKENGNCYNRLIWMRPDGTYEQYDKRHLFSMADEHLSFTAGKDSLLVDLKGWKICPLICYDLRFPVWSRNQSLSYDLLLYVANWPAARVNAWDTLLAARAIENLSYCIGVNRVGTDGNGIPYNGHTAAYSPKGEALLAPQEQEGIWQVTLEKDILSKFREKFPAHLDADHFKLI
ncbi:amidohydrolase [Limibacter armeniacum]|uniref:amidohydrolase n=1 Tax=Limibacter armeniacum TaxID=466084 RepID=UPI002FE50B3E